MKISVCVSRSFSARDRAARELRRRGAPPARGSRCGGRGAKIFCQPARHRDREQPARAAAPVANAQSGRADLISSVVAQRERRRREQLVRDAEERPQRVDAAERIDDALVQEVAPARDDQPRGEQVRRQRRRARRAAGTGCPSMSCTMKRPTRVPASSVVRMKSASNMIAKWYQSAFSAVAAEHAARRSPPCRPRGSARRRCARAACVSPTSARQRLERDRVEREAPAADRLGRLLDVGADQRPAAS